MHRLSCTGPAICWPCWAGMGGAVLLRSAVLRVAGVSGTLPAAQECVWGGGRRGVIADRLGCVVLSVLVDCTRTQSRPVFLASLYSS